MVYDPSLIIRTHSLRGLSTLVGLSPECIPVPKALEASPASATTQSSLNASDLLSIIPLRLMDNSPMVREAAAELAGNLMSIPNSPFLPRLFKHLVNRVLDMQISVRKRAIRSLQQILLLSDSDELRQGAAPLLSAKQRFEVCATLLRRSNDESCFLRRYSSARVRESPPDAERPPVS